MAAQIADLESANDAKQRRIDELEERVNALVARMGAVENASLFTHTLALQPVHRQFQSFLYGCIVWFRLFLLKPSNERSRL